MSMRVIAIGKTGSGKTEWLWRRYLRRLPRVLMVDTVGEWRMKRARGGRFENGERVTAWPVGVDETVEELEALAESGEREWKVVATLSQSQFVELAREYLVPQLLTDSILLEHGPVALFVDEVSLMIPLGERGACSLFQVGRHLGLSVYCATQTISNVNKITTSQAEVVALLGIAEPNDVDYLTRRYSREEVEAAAAWLRGGKYRAAVWADGEFLRLPPEPH